MAHRPTGVLAICGLVLLRTGYNAAIFGATLPALLADGRLALSTQYAGLIGTASVPAMIFGSLGAGMLAEHVGWVWVVGGAVLGCALGAVLCALARTPDWLLLGRLVVGLSLGLVFLLGAGHVVVLGLFLVSGTARSVVRRLSAERPAAAPGRENRLFTAPRLVLGAAHRRITVVFSIGGVCRVDLVAVDHDQGGVRRPAPRWCS
jgi:MFS family permease